MCAPACQGDILLSEQNVLAQLDHLGFPLSKIIDKEIIVDKESKQVYVTFIVDPGVQAFLDRFTLTDFLR